MSSRYRNGFCRIFCKL